MAYEVDGKTIEADGNGYLANPEEWNENIAAAIAAADKIDALTEKHWDVINYLRDEYFNNGGNQPNMRHLLKAMQEKWDDKKLDSKDLYTLFPAGPAMQAPKIGGVPQPKRKGGY
jgi:tRNA 2-thiouridine synthesizing protein E